MLHLADGSVAVGYLLEHEPGGFQFQVARTGGVVMVPWQFLDPPQAEALRRQLGYIAEEAEELLVDVQRLILVNGMEVVGVILEREGPNFVVKVDGTTQVVPKNRVVSINDGGQVPALEIYQTEELYAQGLARLQPNDAHSQADLALYCESILDFPHAVQHYTQAVALAAGVEDTTAWQTAAERAGVKALQTDQLERLREIDRLRRRSLFPQAFEKIAAFRVAYPKTELTAEINKAEALVAKTQERVVKETIASRWFYRSNQLCREAARNAQFDAMMAYVDSDLLGAVRGAVTADLQSLAPGITPEIVEEWFRGRKRGTYKVATYGSGTWLLGSDRAQAGLTKERNELDKKEKAKATAPESDFQKRVDAYLSNQRRLANVGLRGREDQVEERNQTWGAMSLDARAMWVMAYFAEFSGIFDVVPGVAHLCRQCGGTGALESINAGLPQSQGGQKRGGVTAASGPRIERCTLCHGEQIVRRVRYR